MSHWKDKLGEANVLFAKAKAILTDQMPTEDGKGVRPATAEEKAQVEPMMEQGKTLKAEALKLKNLDELRDEAVAQFGAEQAEGDPEPGNGKAGGAPQGSGIKDWHTFLEAVYTAQVSGMKSVDPRLAFFKDEAPKSVNQKDMTGDVGASGGFLIPVEQATQLYAIMGEQAFIRPRATVIRLRRRQINIPVLDQTTTTAGIPHWFGGMQFYWQEEASAKQASDAKFRQITLSAKKLIAYTHASDELVDDGAISLGDFLQGPMGFAGGAIWMEEYAFMRGNGNGQPLGYLNANCTIVEGRNTSGTVVFDDLADMVAKFLPTGQGVWEISQSLMSNLIQLNGPTGNPSYIWQANARDGIPGMILGYPVHWTEKAPSRGSKGDISLVDYKYYVVADRQATTVESTKFDRWAYDETSWRMVHRVDGQPWLSAPLTYEDGVTQVSPFVTLGATAGGS